MPLFSILLVAASAAAGQRLAIPSYFEPGKLWAQLEAAGGQQPGQVGIAIINPDSGPGPSRDGAYAAETKRAQGNGVRVLGYVPTQQGRKASTTVRQQVDTYYRWYGIDGIFFDEGSDSCTTFNYYKGLHDYVKSAHGGGLVVINPGTTTPDCFIRKDAADVLVTFEGSYGDYRGWTPAGWESGYPADRFWHLVYATSTANLPRAFSLSQHRHVGWIYVTGDGLPNPWDTLPAGSYWTDELGRAGR